MWEDIVPIMPYPFGCNKYPKVNINKLSASTILVDFIYKNTCPEGVQKVFLDKGLILNSRLTGLQSE